MTLRTFQQTIQVPFSYPVHFGHDFFDRTHPLLRQLVADATGRIAVFIDQGVAEAKPGISEQVADYVSNRCPPTLVAPPIIVPGGEPIKNDFDLVRQIVDTLLAHKLCRQSYVLVIGGGAVLDAVGFAAALVHRGLRLIRFPSTTLAQNDAGIGVKNGLNMCGAKNAVGTFQPPFAVCNDYTLLDTLPPTHWIGGVSEAFKVALIKDADFFQQLCRDAGRYRQRDRTAMESMIFRCAELHLQHISENGDPFEMGRARPLDFGHWSAHKLEAMSDYRISHGEAVATGILIDSRYAVRQGWLPESVADALHHALKEIGFQLVHTELTTRSADECLALLGGLADFREHLGGDLCVTFPAGLGKKQEINEIDRSTMAQVIQELSLT
jgi:3-dehydroquinate synthase